MCLRSFKLLFLDENMCEWLQGEINKSVWPLGGSLKRVYGTCLQINMYLQEAEMDLFL